MKICLTTLIVATWLAMYTCAALAQESGKLDEPPNPQRTIKAQPEGETDPTVNQKVSKAIDPQKLPREQQAAFLKKLDADKALADTAVSALKVQQPSDQGKVATDALELFCQGILHFGRLHVPTDDKCDYCVAAIRLGDTLKGSVAFIAGPAACPSMYQVQELETLLRSPKDELIRRFEQARAMFWDKKYAEAVEVLSSFLEVPEMGAQRGARMLRGLCFSHLANLPRQLLICAPLSAIMSTMT